MQFAQTWRNCPQPLPVESMHSKLVVASHHSKQILLWIPCCFFHLSRKKGKLQSFFRSQSCRLLIPVAARIIKAQNLEFPILEAPVFSLTLRPSSSCTYAELNAPVIDLSMKNPACHWPGTIPASNLPQFGGQTELYPTSVHIHWINPKTTKYFCDLLEVISL